ncbi:MAG: hypothetical protein Q4E22_02380 [Coriobacteriia bacterium]|nr:hypothetical protein [Coriobacteriia bacterium]
MPQRYNHRQSQAQHFYPPSHPQQRPTIEKDAFYWILLVLSFLLKIISIVYLIFVILSFAGIVMKTLNLVTFTFVLTSLMPDFIAGKWVLPTPFDGLFRTDFAIWGFLLQFFSWLIRLFMKKKY